MRRLTVLGLALFVLGAATPPARAQSATTTRLLLMQAQSKGTPTAADVSLLRVSARSASADTAKVALRMLGQLGRPSLIADISLSLRHALPEVRIEAASALADAAQGLRNAVGAQGVSPATVLTNAQSALITRLGVEADAGVRGALVEALARLPYKTGADAARAEAAILSFGGKATTLSDRLGVAKALEIFVRQQNALHPAGAEVVALLERLARADSVAPGLDLSRDARVRRLAFDALVTIGALGAETITRAAEDGDAQVRRLAMRAIGVTGTATGKLRDGLADISPLVRLETLRALLARGGNEVCEPAIKAAADADMAVALGALDQLAACDSSPAAVSLLARVAGDTADLAVVRGWHRQAHAIVALSAAAPDQARPLLPSYQAATVWQVRAYAARAATQLGDQATLETLTRDPEERVANIALAALSRPLRGHAPSQASALPSATAAEVRRLAAPRARIVVRDVGTFDIALFTTEAPGTVLRFARLADEGYYNGVAFDRLSANAIVQGGHRGSDTAEFPARETGTWPHVRGSVGVSTGESNDAQFFINLVDNPRFDHQLTVFAQVLNGADVVDRLLEGDVIESITIVP